MKNITFIIVLIFLETFFGCGNQTDFLELKDAYLGEEPPDITPKIFAPGIISTQENLEIGCCFSPDGKEFYFSRTEGLSPNGNTFIYVTKYKDGDWTKPEITSFSGTHVDFEPCITLDNKQMFFNRFSRSDTTVLNGIYIMKRKAENWEEPHFFRPGMCLTSSKLRTVYYTDLSRGLIVCSKFVNGEYSDPEKVYGDINSGFMDAHPCISADESFLIFDSRREGDHTQSKLYVAFRDQKYKWSKAINLGKYLNGGIKMCASLSPDGKYLFYSSKGDIYWVSIDVIKNLKSIN